MGQRASDTRGITFEDVRVPKEVSRVLLKHLIDRERQEDKRIRLKKGGNCSKRLKKWNKECKNKRLELNKTN